MAIPSRQIGWSQEANLLWEVSNLITRLTQVTAANGGGGGGLTSVGLSVPSAFSLTNNPLIANGTIGITGAGTISQYIDGTGALQTFPTLTSYVPYTGATATVNLGDNDLEAGSVFVEGATGAGGALRIKQFGSSAANLDGYSTISTLNTGVFYFTAATTSPNFKNFVLNPSGLTDNTLRTYTLPNLDGTLALLSNIPSVTGYVPYTGATGAVNLGAFGITAASIVKSGGTSLQYLMADGSVTTGSALIITNRQTVSYTLALSDADKLVEMNVASANNLTVPLNSVIPFPIGTKVDLTQYGAGQTTVVATGGVTVRSAGGALKLAAQYSGATLVKIATDEWYLFGDITV
jgi:hypothetical protein